LAALIFAESPSVLQSVGVAAVLAGLLALTLKKRERVPVAAPTPDSA
jgi:drug/metabolite transporter (DMT)-like permease